MLVQLPFTIIFKTICFMGHNTHICPLSPVQGYISNKYPCRFHRGYENPMHYEYTTVLTSASLSNPSEC